MTGAINVILPFFTLFIGAFGIIVIGRLLKFDNRITAGLTATLLLVSLIQLIWIMGDSNIDILSFGAAGPGGVTFQPDVIGTFVSATILVIAILITIYSGGSISSEPTYLLYYPLILLSLSGLFGMFFTNDLFNLFLLSELSNLTASALIAFQSRAEGSVSAGYKYLIMSSLGTMIILLGVYFIYKGTGSTDLSVISTLVNNSTRIGAGCFLVGFSIKAGVVPLHTWVPDVYSNSPSAISGLLAGVISKSVLFIVSITCTKLGMESSELGLFLIAFGCLNMLLGSIKALTQKHIRRFLSYSSITHTGYLMFTLGIGHYYQLDSAFSTSIFLFVIAGIAKCLAFLTAGIYEHDRQVSEANDPGNPPKTVKYAPYLLSFALVGLAGIPPLAGFTGKWLVFSSAISTGDVISMIGLVIFLVSSVIGLGGYLPMIVRLFKERDQPDDTNQLITNSSLWMTIPVYMFCVLYIIVSFHPTPWLQIIIGIIK